MNRVGFNITNMKVCHCDADWPVGKQANVSKFGVNTLLGFITHFLRFKQILMLTCSSYFQLDCSVTLLLVGLKEVPIINLLLQGE